MKKVRAAICIIFALSCIVCGSYIVKVKLVEDHVSPVITSENDVISVSVQDDKSKLLEGVKAEDNKDGDLTKEIRVDSMSNFISRGKRTIKYVVFDKSNQGGTLEKTLEYTDYVSPRIYLDRPFRITAAEANKVDLLEGMTASDCLDGDLTKKIRIDYGDGFYNVQPGDYKITVQVSNSAGDTCMLPLDLMVVSGDSRANSEPILSDYIVYTSVNKKIDPMSYVTGLKLNGIEYSYETDGETLAGTREQISVKGDVDYSKPGVYPVEFVYKSEGESGERARMYVVVEGDQNGEK